MKNGLLDFVATPEGQGLLSAAFGGLAGARRGAPLNSIGRAGLAGLAGYSGAQDRISQEAQITEANKYRNMQTTALQAQMDAAKAKAAQEAAKRDALPGLFAGQTVGGGTTTPEMGGIPMFSQGSTVQPTRTVGAGKLDVMAAARAGYSPEEILKLGELSNVGRQKVARTAEVEGPNGTKRIVQMDEYGQEVGPGMNGYVAPVLVDTGDRKVFSKPNAGQSFKINMSPGEVATNARGWADIKTKQDANDINRTAARTQIVEGADGNVYLVDKGTGLSRPTATLGGTTIRAGKSAEDGMKRNRDAADGLELVKMARDLLPGATGSGIGASTDAAGRFFGITSEGGKRAAQLEALGGQLVMKMPRMEGPQSNLDQLLYREMAGKIGDRTVPVAEREAALKTVEGLYQKYGSSGAKAAPAGVPSDIANILNKY